MVLLEDETGIYVGGIVGSNRHYIVPRLIKYGDIVVYDFDWNTRVLKASIEPRSLEVLLKAQGWTPGEDVDMPGDLGYPIVQKIFRFSRVQKVVPLPYRDNQYYYGMQRPRRLGIIPDIKRLLGR